MRLVIFELEIPDDPDDLNLKFVLNLYRMLKIKVLKID
jgi:hypothetical protein